MLETFFSLFVSVLQHHDCWQFFFLFFFSGKIMTFSVAQCFVLCKKLKPSLLDGKKRVYHYGTVKDLRNVADSVICSWNSFWWHVEMCLHALWIHSYSLWTSRFAVTYCFGHSTLTRQRAALCILWQAGDGERIMTVETTKAAFATGKYRLPAIWKENTNTEWMKALIVVRWERGPP